MKIYEVYELSSQLSAKLLKVWEDSVRATHGFLSESEILRIKEYVPQALNDVSHLIVAERTPGNPVAFMGTEKTRLEMLFLSPNERGLGLGKKLLETGIQNYDVREVTVNEQNPDAVGFYKHMGFEPYKRTARDEAGDPYPLLYMKLKQKF